MKAYLLCSVWCVLASTEGVFCSSSDRSAEKIESVLKSLGEPELGTLDSDIAVRFLRIGDKVKATSFRYERKPGEGGEITIKRADSYGLEVHGIDLAGIVKVSKECSSYIDLLLREGEGIDPLRGVSEKSKLSLAEGGEIWAMDIRSGEHSMSYILYQPFNLMPKSAREDLEKALGEELPDPEPFMRLCVFLVEVSDMSLVDWRVDFGRHRGGVRLTPEAPSFKR